PMCGSGTILIEAAMIAANIPAGINKKEFGFERWKDFDPELFTKIREVSLKKMRDPGVKILGFDKAPSAVYKAKDNIKAASLDDFIKVERADFFHSHRPEEGEWTLMFNPPYGERLDAIDPVAFYRQIGDTLKNNYKDATAWIISASLEGLKSLGLRHSRSIPLMNANLEARFVKYEMYQGSKKSKYSADNTKEENAEENPEEKTE
ncbi:MAG: class I SAM-dependent RNA methyltransferase, partial [Flavobacteriales bacterium]|nr:class I SAM-dependent RNA methyltransferase [Flavobacteriales bacterium]